MEEDYTEFINRIKKVAGGHKHKISNSYGVYDAFKFYRKNKPLEKKFVLTESKYFSIIRTINNKLAAMIAEGNAIKLPSNMGSIELRRYKVEPKLNSVGKLIFRAPVDWGSTLKLWFEDEEARKNKILIKSESKSNARIIYNKQKAKYRNQTYFFLQANRGLKRLVHEAFQKGSIDAFDAFKIT